MRLDLVFSFLQCRLFPGDSFIGSLPALHTFNCHRQLNVIVDLRVEPLSKSLPCRLQLIFEIIDVKLCLKFVPFLCLLLVDCDNTQSLAEGG